MEISQLYHNTRPEGELLPQEAAAFDALERLGIDYDRVSSEPADNMEKCAAVSEVLGMPICKNLFLCNRQKTQFYLLAMGPDKPFHTKDLSHQIGSARLSFAPEEELWEKEGYLSDTHTAVAVNVYRQYLKEAGLPPVPTVIASTANPYKFSGSVLGALQADLLTQDDFQNVEALEQLTGVQAPQQLRQLREKPVRFTQVVEKDQAGAFVRQLVEQKNYAALSDILGKAKDNKAARALRRLPRLFGGAEVFQEAYELFDENGAKESLDYLKQIYEYLQELGLGDKVLIDLGLVNLAEYYTGIIFRGYFRGLGEQVLSGGRYDTLLGQFGEDYCAIGFGFNVDLASQGKEPEPEPVPKILVYTQDLKYIPASVQYRKELEKKGIMAENSVFDTLEETLEYARKRGILRVHLVGEKIEEYQMEKGIGENETN